MSRTTSRTQKPLGSNSEAQAPQRSRVERRRTSPRAIVVCAGILSAAVSMAPHAQVVNDAQKVSGTVVSAATQQPVSNARVQYEETGPQTTVQQTPQTTMTNANGYFEFPAGRLGVVTVTARGFGTARRAWPARNSTLGLIVALNQPARMRGAVTDLVTGRLVPAMVTVLVQHPGNSVSHSTIAEDGTFQIEDMPPGPALVTARSVGFAPFVGSATVAAGQMREVRIGLLLAAQITGHVRDADGEPVSGALVSATYPTLAGAGLVEDFVGGQPLTGPDGMFALHGLVPDTPIALQAELGGRRSAVATISVGPGMRRLDVVLTLP